MVDRELKRQIVSKFKKYCSRCEGLCCSKEINAFSFEIKKWPKVKLEVKNNWQKGKSLNKTLICRFNIGKHCPFLLDKSCRMDPAIRPIDCVSYPVYPSIDDLSDETDFNELMVHKSCPFTLEISKDPSLKKLLFKFWNKNLKTISKGEIKIWLGNKRNYWLDKNIIKIKNV